MCRLSRVMCRGMMHHVLYSSVRTAFLLSILAPLIHCTDTIHRVHFTPTIPHRIHGTGGSCPFFDVCYLRLRPALLKNLFALLAVQNIFFIPPPSLTKSPSSNCK